MYLLTLTIQSLTCLMHILSLMIQSPEEVLALLFLLHRENGDFSILMKDMSFMIQSLTCLMHILSLMIQSLTCLMHMLLV
jgi:hypothetical protein